jgi:hypothetical protein
MRASVAAGLVLAAGCSPTIILGDLDGPLCLDSGCGGVAQGGSVPGGSAGANVSGTPAGGTGGSAGTAGTSTEAGAAGEAGMAGQAGALACQPSPADHSCDGLDEACQVTTQDQGCMGTCKGSFVNGTSYMACLAASDFDTAEASCQANGMHLVKIDDADENAVVKDLAPDDYVWIGASNRDDSDVFVWLDGTPFFSFSGSGSVNGAYENFGMNEPAQDQKLRCVQLRRTGDGTWSNWQCSGMQSFVCERY